MAMDGGNEACSSGLSKEVYDALVAKSWSSSWNDTSGDWKLFVHAFTNAIVAHINNNAKTSVDNEDIL